MRPRLHVSLLAVAALSLCGCSLFTRYRLDLAVDPAEGGAVTVVPDKNCYREGEEVTLTAVPADGYAFVGYEGDLVSAESELLLIMEADTSLTATFASIASSNAYVGTGSQGFLVDATDVGQVQYTLSLGAEARDVYFIFTNVGTLAADAPGVAEVTGDFGTARARPAARVAGAGSSEPAAIRGNPLADAFYPEAEELIRSMPRATSRAIRPRGTSEIVGSTSTFYYDSVESTIEATCRAKVEVDGKTLLVWVADNQWGTITSTMVGALAERFLDASGECIYDWVTTIYGDEWATTSKSGLIDDNDVISILLYDIEGDAQDFASAGGIVGFFWAKDNFTSYGSPDYSNHRIMFYLDAPMLAYKDDTMWEITDSWPEEVVSTLAHEFQHMIHFHQKYVINGGSVVTWVNEMCSMVAEDLVSDKLGVPGPRGVDPEAHDDGSGGGFGNTSGFLPRYVYYNDVPVAYWPATTDTNTLLMSYSVNYAFGAYLARSFGGSGLFQAIVQSRYAGRDAIDQALTAVGHTSEDFASVLRKWGIANLLSDSTEAPQGYVYNAGGWIAADLGSAAYSLGSINLYNYRYTGDGADWTGPYMWDEIPSTYGIPASSTWYYQAAYEASGDLVWNITLDGDTQLEVVVKEPQ